MSHKPAPYAWLAVLSGLCIATLIMSATALRQLSSLPAPCECKPVKACGCGDVVSCTCDHAALLELHAALEASIGELRVSVEALEDRASDGESKVLKGYKGILEQFQNIQRRLDKLEGRKPPVRRQASCGAHPPSCEGIAALGADGEPDSVTGILLCATADESTLKPCQPLRNAFRVWQTWEIEQGKRAEKRRKAWAALKLFIALQDGQAT